MELKSPLIQYSLQNEQEESQWPLGSFSDIYPMQESFQYYYGVEFLVLKVSSLKNSACPELSLVLDMQLGTSPQSKTPLYHA